VAEQHRGIGGFGGAGANRGVAAASSPSRIAVFMHIALRYNNLHNLLGRRWRLISVGETSQRK